jgi:hypothetical protein
VLKADYFLQGVAVAAGHHEIRLVYRDPTIAQGLLGSAIAWGALVIGFAWSRRRTRAAPAIETRASAPAPAELETDD